MTRYLPVLVVFLASVFGLAYAGGDQHRGAKADKDPVDPPQVRLNPSPADGSGANEYATPVTQGTAADTKGEARTAKPASSAKE
jgi:hypothetical protein